MGVAVLLEDRHRHMHTALRRVWLWREKGPSGRDGITGIWELANLGVFCFLSITHRLVFGSLLNSDPCSFGKSPICLPVGLQT